MISRLSLAAAVSFATFSTLPNHQAAAQSQPEIVVGATLNMSSTSYIDSFDSNDSNKSTNGLYDAAKFQRNGNVGILNNINSDLRNGFIFGNLYYSGSAAVKNTRNVQGVIATPFNAPMPASTDPTWVPNITYTGSTAVAARQFTGGSAQAPTLIKVNGDFSLPGGTTFRLLPGANAIGYIQIWVTGKLNISGSSRLLQDPWVRVIWIVDKDITTSGDSYQNGTGHSVNLSFIGVNTGKVNISGVGNLPATINASLRDVTVSGGGSLSGAILAKTLTLAGNSSVHADEALLAH